MDMKNVSFILRTLSHVSTYEHSRVCTQQCTVFVSEDFANEVLHEMHSYCRRNPLLVDCNFKFQF